MVTSWTLCNLMNQKDQWSMLSYLCHMPQGAAPHCSFFVCYVVTFAIYLFQAIAIGNNGFKFLEKKSICKLIVNVWNLYFYNKIIHIQILMEIFCRVKSNNSTWVMDMQGQIIMTTVLVCTYGTWRIKLKYCTLTFLIFLNCFLA